ncbi:MAG: hypothetical protein CL908_27385 [Deltaproteobacteria bacterium]|nr:hypothetical protein [Deltaproteobacteria bacterium]
MRIRFGEFELDEERFLLSRDGERVAVRPKVFDLLTHLIRERERVVLREELMGLLWGTTAVCVGSLSGLVNELRNALGEQARGRSSIRTVHARGYQFVASVETLAEDLPRARWAALESVESGPCVETERLNALLEANGVSALPAPLARALLAHVQGQPARLGPVVDWLVAGSGFGTDARWASPSSAADQGEELSTTESSSANPPQPRMRRVGPPSAMRGANPNTG